MAITTTTTTTATSSIYMKSMDDISQKINTIQKRKKNHFAIIVCPVISSTIWNELQYTIGAGDTRILYVNNRSQIAPLIQSILENMGDSYKLNQQMEFIEDELKQLSSSFKARLVIHETCSRLAIDKEEEQQLIMESLPSLASFLSVTKIELEENCPIDIDSIHKLIDFIHDDEDDKIGC